MVRTHPLDVRLRSRDPRNIQPRRQAHRSRISSRSDDSSVPNRTRRLKSIRFQRLRRTQQQPILTVNNHWHRRRSHIDTGHLENLPRPPDNGQPLRQNRTCNRNRRRQHPLRRTRHSYRSGGRIDTFHIVDNPHHSSHGRFPSLGATRSTPHPPLAQQVESPVPNGNVPFQICPLPLLPVRRSSRTAQHQHSLRRLPRRHSNRHRPTRHVRKSYWKHQENLPCALHPSILRNSRPSTRPHSPVRYCHLSRIPPPLIRPKDRRSLGSWQAHQEKLAIQRQSCHWLKRKRRTGNSPCHSRVRRGTNLRALLRGSSSNSNSNVADYRILAEIHTEQGLASSSRGQSSQPS